MTNLNRQQLWLYQTGTLSKSLCYQACSVSERRYVVLPVNAYHNYLFIPYLLLMVNIRMNVGQICFAYLLTFVDLLWFTIHFEFGLRHSQLAGVN